MGFVGSPVQVGSAGTRVGSSTCGRRGVNRTSNAEGGRRVVAPSFDRRRGCVRMGGFSAEKVKQSSTLLNVYILSDAQGYPIMQPHALSTLNDMKKELPELADSQIAVVPFYAAYEKVVMGPIPAEDDPEGDDRTSIIFRFVPALDDLDRLMEMMKESNVDVEEAMPELPAFYFCAPNADGSEGTTPTTGPWFLSYSDCVAAREEEAKTNPAVADSPIKYIDLMNLLKDTDTVLNLIPSLENEAFVKTLFEKAGMS